MNVAAVLSIGTELTRGELVNTNASWLGEQLTALGFDVRTHLTVDDDRANIAAALESLSPHASVVVATGGLGPTTDDLTADAVAAALGIPLRCDVPSLDAIRRRYAARGRPLSDAAAKMADLPEGATALPNAIGTAPGFRVSFGDCPCFFLPGVPVEMKSMFRETVRPAIGSLGHEGTFQAHLRTFGLPESEVGARLAELEAAHPDVIFGYRASFPEVEVKILVRGDSGADAKRRALDISHEARAQLGEAVYGDREDSFAGVVGQRLRDARLTLALAESCTGGLVGQMLTSVAGSSDYVLLDAVTYANSAKTAVLGVSPEILRAHGAVSAETAIAMAEGARRLADADLAVSITGVAGPGGGSDDKPVGTVWLALTWEGKTVAVRHHLAHDDRGRVRVHAAYLALEMIRRRALGVDPAAGPSSRTQRERRET